MLSLNCRKNFPVFECHVKLRLINPLVLNFALNFQAMIAIVFEFGAFVRFSKLHYVVRVLTFVRGASIAHPLNKKCLCHRRALPAMR
jgi:hypothetical protein